MEVKTALPRDVAIFIGENGTGKTTLINLIVAALTADYDALASWQFEQITIRLVDPDNEGVHETIQVQRAGEVSPPVFQYVVAKKKYVLEPDTRRRFPRFTNLESSTCRVWRSIQAVVATLLTLRRSSGHLLIYRGLQFIATCRTRETRTLR